MSWKQQYIEGLLEEGLDESGMDALQDVKQKNLPPFLYRYNAIGEYTFKNLSANLTRLSPADSFNDPYDSCFTISANDLSSKHFHRPLEEAFNDSFLAAFLTTSDLEKIKAAPNQLEAFIDQMLSLCRDLIPN